MAQDDKRRLIEMLEKLISIRSVTGEENRLVDFLEKHLLEIGLNVGREEIDSRYNLFAYRGKARYLIATHVDTVPPWGFRRAFKPRFGDERIFGRGAVDTKGQIASLLVALENTDAPCAIALFVDEERDAKGSEEFTPKWKFDGALVLEPTDFKICTRQAGSIEIFVETKGKMAHGATPERGKSAIDVFIELYKDLKSLEHIKKRPADFSESGVNLGWIRGGRDCQLVADYCRGEIDIPIFPGDDVEVIKGEIDRVLTHYGAAAKVKIFDEPVEISRDEKVVKLLERAVSGIRKTEHAGMPAWTDAANLIEKGIPSVIFGAGDLSLAHTERESIAVDDLLDLYRILKRFIELSGMESSQLL